MRKSLISLKHSLDEEQLIWEHDFNQIFTSSDLPVMALYRIMRQKSNQAKVRQDSALSMFFHI